MAGSSTMPDYDVIVVGSGPAGGSAAYFLGEAGKRVLVLEKERLPRYKTCGGGLSLRFLRQQFPFSFEPIQKNPVASISYHYHRRAVTIPLAMGAMDLVMRAEFDAYLLHQVRAEVLQGAAVQSVTESEDGVTVQTKDGQRYSAAYLIGADGANSMVAHALGLRRRRTLAAAIEAEVVVSPEVWARYAGQMLFIFGEIHYGYLWVFAKDGHLSVGIGALHPNPGELQQTLRRVMTLYGIQLGDTPLHGHPIPIYTHREPVSTRRTLLAGDAAGMADPLSGEGIRFAIKSGRLAAEAIIKERTEQYAHTLHRAIGLNHFFTTLISLTFYFIQAPFVFLGTPNPFSTQAVVKMLADQSTAARFILTGLLTLPVFLSTELLARLLGVLGFSRLQDRIRAWVYPADVRQSYRTGSFPR